MAGRMMRVAEVADRFSCSERTVRRWIADGTLSSIKFNGIRLIAEETLDRLIDGDDPAWLENAADNSDPTKEPLETTHFTTGFDTDSTRNIGEEE